MLELRDVTKRYEGYELNISMEIPEGQVIGLVGKNGAGKSTIIKLILGLVRPNGGTVTAPDKADMGVAMAESGFSGFLKIKDINKILKKFYKDYDEAFFLKKCEELRLPLDKKINDFSTGMKAKLRVLIAISHRAKFLLLDEPTAGLDIEARNDILNTLREYLAEDESRCMLITSHISSDLEGLCDSIYLIHEGKLVLHEDTDVILAQYAVLKVDDATYGKLDKSYIIATKKEMFGYICVTNEKQYYIDNYPGIIVENGSLDDLILFLTLENA